MSDSEDKELETAKEPSKEDDGNNGDGGSGENEDLEKLAVDDEEDGKKNELAKVFGSDYSESEEEEVQPSASDSDDYEEKKSKKKKKSKRSKESKDKRKKEKSKKKRSKHDDDVEDDDENEDNEKPKSKKARLDTPPPEVEYDDEGNPLPPSFDEIMKQRKQSRKKVEVSHEDMKANVHKFLIRMNQACEKDREANRQNKPAVHKMQMLKEVVHELSKVDERVQDYLIENGVLVEVKNWLDPLPDNSPPSLAIRTKMYECLEKMKRIDREHLRTSAIGKRINERSKAKDEPESNRKILKRLLERWMRKVFDTSDQYTDLHADREEEDEGRRSRRPLPEVDLTESTGPKPGEKGFQYRAFIPMKDDLTFKRMPRSKIEKDEVEDMKTKKDRMSSTKQNIDSKLISMKKTKNIQRTASKVSIEGRGLH